MTADYRIYSDLAHWWPLISPPSEYSEEAAYLAALIRQLAAPVPSGRPVEVLDLGSGGGHMAVHLTRDFDLTLVDVSADMLAASRRLLPDRPHIQGDMREVRLHREFDVVLVHDAIDYILGRDDLRLVIGTAAVHCRPGGLALFVPDYLADTFAELTGSGGGGTDQDGRTATFDEHTWDPCGGDDQVQADYEFTLRTADGRTTTIQESHRLSAFPRELWRALVSEVGLRLEPAPALRTGRPPGNLFITRREVTPAQ
ncbi:MAG TPA: class I SAM-dependent methyltransferase [Streptosporangiaceae bacterium]|nr:class I SAM-dependent methyltransferase [Streptosporangiaceae bacterium]